MSSTEETSPWMLALGSAALFAFVYIFKPFGDDDQSDRYGIGFCRALHATASPMPSLRCL